MKVRAIYRGDMGAENNQSKLSRDRFKKYDVYVARSTSRRHMGEVKQRSSELNQQQPVQHTVPLPKSATQKKSVVQQNIVRPQKPTIATEVVRSTKDIKHASVSRLDVSTSRQKSRRVRTAAEQAVTDAAYDATFNTDDGSAYVTTKKGGGIGMRLFYGFGVLVFVATMLLSAQALVFNKQAKDEVSVLAAETQNVDAQGVPQGTGSEPAEDKPDENAFFAYQVDPDKPRYLRIPTQSVYSRIKELGLTTDGAVDAPWNVHDTGWYNGSIKPGSKNGVSLILGHTSGYSMPGVFKSIGEMKKDDIVEVERGDGEVVKYIVDKVEEYELDKIDMRKILYEVEKGTHSLRLMTCSGQYDSLNREYLSRTVVYTTEIK